MRLKALLVICMVWVLAIAVFYPMFLGEPAYARPLNACPGGHCYGAVVWTNPILGAIAWINTVHLYSVNDGVNHISEELWLIDNNSNHTCYHNGVAQGGAWVETGEATRVGYSGNWYFWGDCRPGSIDLYHWPYQPPSGDYGQAMEYVIDRGSSSTFSIAASNTVTGNLLFTGTSTSNSMSPNDIQTGLETTNNSYSVTHADNDYFTHNQYHGTNGAWGYQHNSDGSIAQYKPPYFYWNTPPHSSSTGGQGETTCC